MTNLTISITGLPVEFCKIPGGTYQVGSPETEPGRWDDEPLRTVMVSDYYIAEVACSQKFYKELMGTREFHFQGDDLPAMGISFDDAIAAVAAMQKYAPPNMEFYLPTEDEWEIACRGGNSTTFWSGDNPPIGAAIDWDYNDGPASVYSGLQNNYGLYHMHGNVLEWCDSVYFPEDLGDRVLRGGAWHDPAGLARSAFRRRSQRDTRSDLCGFRFALRSVK